MGRIGVLILGAAATLCAAWPAAAQPRSDSCFRLSMLQSTRPDGDRRIYFRVGVNDFYRIDLQYACTPLRDPVSHLIIEPTTGMDVLCGPLDFTLKAASEGTREACFVKSITRLTPAEAAAIPKGSRP